MAEQTLIEATQDLMAAVEEISGYMPRGEWDRTIANRMEAAQAAVEREQRRLSEPRCCCLGGYAAAEVVATCPVHGRPAPAGWDKIEGDPPGRTTLPFFATNGAIVLEQEDRDRWIVSVALRLGNSVRVVVDTDTTMVDGDWLVENPPTWLHTEEDLIDVRRMARDGVRALLETRFQAAKASMAPAFSEAECSSDADPGS